MAAAWYGRTFGELPAKADANRTGVAFVAVLFGIVVSQLASGSVEPVKALIHNPAGKQHFIAPGASLAHYLVGFTLTIASFIGYFSSKNGPQLKIAFFNLPLFQIIVDSAMVVTYLFVAVYAEGRSDLADARPEAVLVTVSFALYAVWDALGYVLRGDPLSQLALGRLPKREYGRRRVVTIVGFLVSVGVTLWVSYVDEPHHRSAMVVRWDIALIVLLVMYRVLKEAFDTKLEYRGDKKVRSVKAAPAGLPDIDRLDWERVVPTSVKNDFALLQLVKVETIHVITATEQPAAERLRAAGAIEIGWTAAGEVACLTASGVAYVALGT
jgi:hypothetical protein